MPSLSQAPHLEGLPPSHGTFQGHAAHDSEWSDPLRPKGSLDTCISKGISAFLLCTFTAHDTFQVNILGFDRAVLQGLDARIVGESQRQS